ncbi:hypothetical protein DBR37_05645 [Herminiimonas sp. KBW02]|nr:hypothetical protein DBR37_05645 [Herminiimonas sp. KBW02]
MDMITSDLIYFVAKSVLFRTPACCTVPAPLLIHRLQNLQQGMSIVAAGNKHSYRTETQVRVGKDEGMQTFCHKYDMSDAI